jgi:hypothetical protein
MFPLNELAQNKAGIISGDVFYSVSVEAIKGEPIGPLP